MGVSEAQKRQQIAELYAAYQNDPSPALKALEARWHFVPGMGDVNPPLVFVGEAPGRREDELRRPFCGNSGRVLDDLLESVGYTRNDVWVTNCVKYRPDEHNRDPSQEEKAASRLYLIRELAILNCTRIVALGKQPLSVLAGHMSHPPSRAQWAPTRLGGQPYWLLPLYHPAVGVYQRSKMPLLLKEFRKVLEGP